MRQEILIQEEFDNPQGKLTNYDAGDTDQRSALLTQSHVDIRALRSDNLSAPIGMALLDSLSMEEIEAMSMNDLDNLTLTYQYGENWTGGICVKNPDRNNLRELQITCTPGIPTFASSIVYQQTGIGVSSFSIQTVDLLTGFQDSDFLSIALPGFPLDSLDLTQCFIDFTSNAQGDFDVGPLATISFQNYMLLLSLSNSGLQDPLIDGGDNELRFPRGDIAGIDLSKITGVRFRLFATQHCVVRIASLRLLSSEWQYAPYDINTATGNLEISPSRNGSVLVPYEFPSGSWPTVYRANNPPNAADPRPIDGRFSIDFNTGSMLNATGVSDYAIELDSGHINMGDTSALQLTGPLTLETWCNPNALIPGDVQGLFSKWDDVNGERGFRLGITASGELEFQCSSDGTAVSTATSTGANITPNTWQYVACTYSAGTVNFYVNKNLISTVTGLSTSIFNSPRAFRVGTWLSTS